MREKEVVGGLSTHGLKSGCAWGKKEVVGILKKKCSMGKRLGIACSEAGDVCCSGGGWCVESAWAVAFVCTVVGEGW